MSESYKPERLTRPSLDESYKYLNSLVLKVQRDINHDLSERYGVSSLVDERGAIRMKAYRALDRELYEADKGFVKERERSMSQVENPRVRAFHIEKFGLKSDATDEEIVEKYLQEREKEKSKQLEMMMTVLLHKAFGHKYIVVRSSAYDDYANGIDNVLVNKDTGDVVCAFDEVRDHENSDRKSDKHAKIIEKTRKGGLNLRYGFTISNKKLELKSSNNLPLFCLGLNSDEYDELMDSLTYETGQGLNIVERKFMDKIISAIGGQMEELLADEEVQKQATIVSNLKKVGQLLDSSK